MIERLHASPRGLHFSLSEDTQRDRRLYLHVATRGRHFRLSDYFEHKYLEEYERHRPYDYLMEQITISWLRWIVRKERVTLKKAYSTGNARDLGKMRVYIQKLLFQTEVPPRQKRRAKLVLQSLIGELQQRLVDFENDNQEDINVLGVLQEAFEPYEIPHFLPSKFREVWPDQWELAETLWREHINTLCSKLRKRLHLVHLFRKARERAISRLYCPGSKHYQEAKERFEAIQQELTSSSSSSAVVATLEEKGGRKNTIVDKKRQRGDDEIQKIDTRRPVKQRKC